MKRWPLIISFVLFIAFCASLAYWAMQFLKPPVRPVAAPPPSVQPPPDLQVAASLFGGKGTAAVASNFQLKGVVVSGTPGDSVAILSADGKPAQAIRASMEIAPGVKVKEVHRRYVVISDQGVEKRVELPEESTAQVNVEASREAPVAVTPKISPRSAPAMPPAMVNNPPAQAQIPAAGNNPNTFGGVTPTPAPTTSGASMQPNTGMPAVAPSAPVAGAPQQQANPAAQPGNAPNPANVPAPGTPMPAPAFPQGQQQ
jgi:general secretion pathway protein C